MKNINNPQRKDWSQILERPTKTVEDIEKTVNQIFGDVQKNGDAAVKKYTQLFDGVSLDNVIVSIEEINASVPPAIIKSNLDLGHPKVG